MDLRTIGIAVVYIEDEVRKSITIPKLSVLLAHSLKFKIVTSSCYVISVRWKL